MKAPFYIISDNHFMMKDDNNEKKRRKRLFSVLDKIKKEGKGTLLIGGDFFDFWFETNAIIPNGYKDLIDKLGNLQKYNIDIHYSIKFNFFHKVSTIYYP